MAGAAEDVAGAAVFADLSGVAGEVSPSFDLEVIDGRQAPAQVVAAVPLEPAAWVWFDDPAFLFPDGQGLAAFDAEEVQVGVWFVGELCVLEPAE